MPEVLADIDYISLPPVKRKPVIGEYTIRTIVPDSRALTAVIAF